jgi:enoyl-CoA hydratase/carnithine racemase
MAVITNNRPEKRNTFDSEMNGLLLEILAECRERRDVRALLWRGEGSGRSAGRDVSAIGKPTTSRDEPLAKRSSVPQDLGAQS